MEAKLRRLLTQGREAYGLGRHVEAERHLRELVDAGIDFADIFNMLGVICHEQSRLSEAVEAFERALAINDRYTEAALNLAVTYNDLGRYDDAKSLYDRTVARSEESTNRIDSYVRGKIANMHADLAQAYSDVGAWDEAIFELRKATALRPDFPDLRVRLGELLQQRGELAAARVELEAAVSARPDFVKAHLVLGVVCLSLGDKPRARVAWQAALALEPGQRAAQAYLRMADSLRPEASRRVPSSGPHAQAGVMVGRDGKDEPA